MIISKWYLLLKQNSYLFIVESPWRAGRWWQWEGVSWGVMPAAKRRVEVWPWPRPLRCSVQAWGGRGETREGRWDRKLWISVTQAGLLGIYLHLYFISGALTSNIVVFHWLPRLWEHNTIVIFSKESPVSWALLSNWFLPIHPAQIVTRCTAQAGSETQFSWN